MIYDTLTLKASRSSFNRITVLFAVNVSTRPFTRIRHSNVL